MRAAISLLALLLSMCTDASTQDVSTELKELRDMVVDLKARQVASDSKVEVLEAENKAVKGRLVASETKVEALEKALQDTKAEMKTETTSKVAFSAALRESRYGFTESESDDLNVVFKKDITNVGEAYSNTTGFFTAPVRGVYYFRFTVADGLDNRFMTVSLRKNGERLVQLQDHGTDGYNSYLSSGLTLQLEKGDAVNMVLPPDRRLYDFSDYNYSTFSGFLLFPL